MDAEHTIVLIGAILGSGGLFALIQFLLQKRGLDKLNNVQADKTAAEAWAALAKAQAEEIAQMHGMIQTLRDRVDSLEANKAAADQRIDELEAEIGELRDWIIKQGLTPPPRKGKM